MTPYSSGSAIAPSPKATIPRREAEQGAAAPVRPGRPALHGCQCAPRRRSAVLLVGGPQQAADLVVDVGHGEQLHPVGGRAGRLRGLEPRGGRRVREAQPQVDPGGRRGRHRGELPPAHERHVGAPPLQDDVVAERGGRLPDGVEDRPERGLRAGVLDVDVLLDGGPHPAGVPGGRVGDRPLAVLLDAVHVLQPPADGVLVERVDAGLRHERDPVLQGPAGALGHRVGDGAHHLVGRGHEETVMPSRAQRPDDHARWRPGRSPARRRPARRGCARHHSGFCR